MSGNQNFISVSLMRSANYDEFMQKYFRLLNNFKITGENKTSLGRFMRDVRGRRGIANEQFREIHVSFVENSSHCSFMFVELCN